MSTAFAEVKSPAQVSQDVIDHVKSEVDSITTDSGKTEYQPRAVNHEGKVD